MVIHQICSDYLGPTPSRGQGGTNVKILKLKLIFHFRNCVSPSDRSHEKLLIVPSLVPQLTVTMFAEYVFIYLCAGDIVRYCV